MKFISIQYLSLIVFLLISVTVYSQETKLKFGVKAGWNFSNVNAVDENGDRSGYLSGIIDEAYAGFLIEKQFSSKSNVQISPLVSFTEAITFIEFPVYFKYNFYRNFHFIFGPKLNYIPDEQFNNNYYFSKRLGISGDICINYKFSDRFTLEGTFSKGFTKQYDDLILT